VPDTYSHSSSSSSSSRITSCGSRVYLLSCILCLVSVSTRVA
jgi:hypothetical protein